MLEMASGLSADALVWGWAARRARRGGYIFWGEEVADLRVREEV